ncbi:MAG: homoserine O-acetyltransferase [Cyclobacteriaceae bacterium]|nr:homoserine O-acetyltransferase [Cyclobacteriaceae bacterium]
MSSKIYKHKALFELELGSHIEGLQIAYHTYGTLNKEKSNVVWVFHALTASSDVMDWWPGLFGELDFFNPKEYFIICANVLGSPYGSTAPTSLDFPLFTVRDVVNAELLLVKHLKIDNIHVGIGGSFGGNQALEFAYSFTGIINNLIMIASSAKESAWSQAIHEAQRLAIKADQTFGKSDGGKAGLKAARGVALLTYRTSSAYIAQQSDSDDKMDDFKAASYIRYQGDKLVKRFTALSFYYLSKCLDTHHIGRARGGEKKALSKITTRTLAIGFTSDMLIPFNLTQGMAEQMPNATFQPLNSDFGHDGFLIETSKLTKVISNFLH